MSSARSEPQREVVGTFGKQQVAACHDGSSKWIEIAGPKGGNAHQMAPARARTLIALLTTAIDRMDGIR